MTHKNRCAWTKLKTSEIENWINENCHSARDRKILKMRMLDHEKFSDIAEIIDMSLKQTKNIVYKYNDILEQSLENI